MGKDNEREKLLTLLDYWIEHNNEHKHEYEQWINKIRDMGYKNLAIEISRVVELSDIMQHHFIHALNILAKTEKGIDESQEKNVQVITHHHEHITFHVIGVIHTPYVDTIPEEAKEKDGDFTLEIYYSYIDKVAHLKTGTQLLIIYTLRNYETHASMEHNKEHHHDHTGHNSQFDLNAINVATVTVQKYDKGKIKVTPIAVMNGTRILLIKQQNR